jgi:tetratricopeptide (TPR) repeat protein/O-antigen ligase
VHAVYRAALGTYLFVLVLVIYSGTNDPTIHIKYLLTAWAAGVLAGSYLLVTWFLRLPLRRPAVFLEVALGLLALFLVSTLFSEFRAISLLETSRFFALFALYWIAAQVFETPAQILRLFTAFCAAMGLAAIYAVMQKTGLDPFPWHDTTSDTYTNLPATFGNPNFAAHALILALIMIVCLVRAGTRWVLWLAPLLLFHFHSTDQRAGWIALAGAALLVTIGLLVLRRPGRSVASVTMVMGLFVLVGLAGFGATMLITQARTGHLFPLDLSLLLRYQSYVSATRMLFDAPFLGQGPAVYGLAYSPYWTPFEQAWFAQEIRMNEHVHNDLLELAIDGGLLAAGLYLAMLVLGMTYGLLLAAQASAPALRSLGFAFAALFCAFGIDGLFGFNLRVPVTAALFFLLMGALDGLWTHARPDVTPTGFSRFTPWLRCAFLLLLLLCTWRETRVFASEYHFRIGTKAQEASQFEVADTAFRKAETYAPWNAAILRRRGLLELDRNNFTGALEVLDRARASNPYYVLTHLPIARANLMLAQRDISPQGAGAEAAVAHLNEARANANSVLVIAPEFPEAFDLLGRIEAISAIVNRDHAANPDPAVQAQYWKEARRYLNLAINQGPKNSGELYRMLMQVELGLGNLDGAEAALIGAAQVAPDEARTWAIFFDFARQHKRFERMREALRSRIEQLNAMEAPGEAERDELASAHRWLATLQLEGFADVDAALDAYARSVEFAPQHPELWDAFARFARANQRRPDFDTALRDACTRLRSAGGAPLPQLEAVEAVLADPAANLDQAGRVLLAGVRSYPNDSEIPIEVAYGWALEILQDVYDALAAQGSAPCESALNLGIAAASLNQLELANRRFENARDCLTDDRRVALAVHWADTKIRLQQGEEALALLDTGEAQFPDNLEIRWTRARILVRLNRMDEARVIYDVLLADPELTPEAKVLLEREIALIPKRG